MSERRSTINDLLMAIIGFTVGENEDARHIMSGSHLEQQKYPLSQAQVNLFYLAHMFICGSVGEPNSSYPHQLKIGNDPAVHLLNRRPFTRVKNWIEKAYLAPSVAEHEAIAEVAIQIAEYIEYAETDRQPTATEARVEAKKRAIGIHSGSSAPPPPSKSEGPQ